MATVNYEIVHNSAHLKVIKWETLTNTNVDGQPYVFSGRYPDKSVQVFGTFGTGGTVKLQGTNEVTSPTNWYPLLDPQGNEISITAAKIEQVLENTYQVRPYVTAGTGVDLDVYLCIRG
jgi:hypothetical protein